MLGEEQRMQSGKNIAYTLLIFITALALQACTSKVRLELEGKGIPYTADGFVDAVKSRNREVVTSFINSGFDVNACKMDKSGSEDNETALYAAVWNGDLQTAKLLFDHGYKVNEKMCKMKTPPLHLAAMRGLVDMAGLLIEKGDVVNKKDSFGMTPLMLAVQMRHPVMVGFLKSKGAK
jgi:ankyrin repeat protein